MTPLHEGMLPTDAEMDQICTALAAQPAPTPVSKSWAFCCHLRPTHQRGGASFQAQASDLEMPCADGHLPYKVLATTPDHRHVLFVHAWREQAGSVHVYQSAAPHRGLTLIVWND